MHPASLAPQHSPGSLGCASSPWPELPPALLPGHPPARRTGWQTAPSVTKDGCLALENTHLFSVRVLPAQEQVQHADGYVGMAPALTQSAINLWSNSFLAPKTVSKHQWVNSGKENALRPVTPPPAGPELYVSRSTPGGSAGCQSSSGIPGLTPSPLSPSSWGSGRCPVSPADSRSPSLSPTHVRRYVENSMILLTPP